jgi:predicted HAD superfamily Cof-like phosphohydrolase
VSGVNHRHIGTSLAWSILRLSILTSVHRAGTGKLHPKMWKHFQAVTHMAFTGNGANRK